MFVNYKNYTKGAMLQYHKSKNNFNFDKMCELVDSTLTQYLPWISKRIKIKFT